MVEIEEQSPFGRGFKLYGGVFESQEAAQEAVGRFVEAGRHELHGDPELFYSEQSGKYKVRVVARPKEDHR